MKPVVVITKRSRTADWTTRSRSKCLHHALGAHIPRRAARYSAHTGPLHFLVTSLMPVPHLMRTRPGAAVMTRSTLIELSELTIDINEKTVRRGTDRIPLTPHDICSSVPRRTGRRGRVCARTSPALWRRPSSEERGANMIDVYIGYLRRKLGTTAIATKRGKGYVVAPRRRVRGRRRRRNRRRQQRAANLLKQSAVGAETDVSDGRLRSAALSSPCQLDHRRRGRQTGLRPARTAAACRSLDRSPAA